MKAHEHIVSGHHVAAVSDMEKWIAAINDIAEQIQEVREGSFRAEYKLLIAQTRLLALRKRIEERAAAPEPPPDGLEMYALLERLWKLGEAAKTFPMLALEKKLLDIIEETRRILAKARGEDAK